MRWQKILTRTLLILSIINFALAAPVVARERPDVRLNTNVTTAPQKRQGPQDSLDEEGPTNVPGLDHAPLHPTDILSQLAYDSPPPTPDHVPDHAPPPSPLANILSQEAYPDSPPPTPDNLPPSPGSPTGSQLPEGLIPVAGSLSPPPPPFPHSSQQGTSDDHFPSPSGGVDPEMHSLLNPSPDSFPTEFMDNILKGKFKRRISSSDTANSVQKDTGSFLSPSS